MNTINTAREINYPPVDIEELKRNSPGAGHKWYTSFPGADQLYAGYKSNHGT